MCPVVVTPDHGSYTLPVAVRRDIILSTFNIPAEVWTTYTNLALLTRTSLRISLSELDFYFVYNNRKSIKAIGQ